MTSAPIDAAVLVGFGQTRQPSLDVLRARRVPVVVIEGDAGPDIPRIELDNSAAQQLLDSHGLRTLTRRAHLLLLSCICRRRR